MAGVLYKKLPRQKIDASGMREVEVEEENSMNVGLFLNVRAILIIVVILDIGR